MINLARVSLHCLRYAQNFVWKMTEKNNDVTIKTGLKRRFKEGKINNFFLK